LYQYRRSSFVTNKMNTCLPKRYPTIFRNIHCTHRMQYCTSIHDHQRIFLPFDITSHYPKTGRGQRNFEDESALEGELKRIQVSKQHSNMGKSFVVHLKDVILWVVWNTFSTSKDIVNSSIVDLVAATGIRQCHGRSRYDKRRRNVLTNVDKKNRFVVTRTLNLLY